MGKKTRVLLDIDSPTRNQIKKALTHHRMTGQLFLPEKYEQERLQARDLKCGGCGRDKNNLNLKIYYGEKFCSDCVEKWKSGYK